MSACLLAHRLGGSVHLRAGTGVRSLRAPLQAAQAPRRLQVSAVLHDPWATLGVSRNASEKEVKQAHRRLVKQHHPDVRKGEDLVAQAQFLRIQEAYELIMGKRAGKDVDGRPTEKSSWDFHDWFWSFKMKRKQGVREQAATFRSQWQAQMAGLKQKAAAKRWKQGRRRPAAGADPAADSGPAAATAGAAAAGPASSPAARERVWRSMTKNARNADKAAAERAAAQQTLGATGRSAPQAVGAGSQQQAQQQQAQQQQQRAQEVPRQQPQQPRHAAAAAQHSQQHTATDEAASHSHSGSSSSSHAARLRQLMEHAAALVQGRQPGAGGHAATTHAASDAHAHAAHTQPEAAGQAGPGRHWRGHVTLDQLASLLGGGSAGNAVPADEQLHRRFEAARRAQQGAAAPTTAAADQPDAAAADEGPQAEPESQHAHQQQRHDHQQHHYGSAHARKFANRGDVEERLSSQLAGLKRRAALKQEVQSTC